MLFFLVSIREEGKIKWKMKKGFSFQQPALKFGKRSGANYIYTPLYRILKENGKECLKYGERIRHWFSPFLCMYFAGIFIVYRRNTYATVFLLWWALCWPTSMPTMHIPRRLPLSRPRTALQLPILGYALSYLFLCSIYLLVWFHLFEIQKRTSFLFKTSSS